MSECELLESLSVSVSVNVVNKVSDRQLVLKQDELTCIVAFDLLTSSPSCVFVHVASTSTELVSHQFAVNSAIVWDGGGVGAGVTPRGQETEVENQPRTRAEVKG